MIKTVAPRPQPAREHDIYTVSRLNREAKRLLEGGLPMLLVEGEISNLAMPASGHWYFSLKDANAQIRCAMFRGRNRALRIRPENGLHVVVRGRVSLYEPRGDFQLIVEHLRDAGEGALQRAFEQLKTRLAQEGLFDAGHKQPLPALPARIGVITSPSGAVIRDICHVLARRFPGIAIRVYPVPVQGEAAAPAIVAALELAAQRKDCDVLIVGRGGGSLEDLWPFNEEAVARAIAACPIPVVSAVGHETDVTIADFVADLRAPTPSAAAELVAPDSGELQRTLAASLARIHRALRTRLDNAASELKWLDGRHRQSHPGRRVNQLGQRLDELERRLVTVMASRLAHHSARVDKLGATLALAGPRHRLLQMHNRSHAAGDALKRAMTTRLRDSAGRLGLAARALAAIGPQATLDRGYAIVSREEDQSIVTDAATLVPDQRVSIRLARGETRAAILGQRKKS